MLSSGFPRQLPYLFPSVTALGPWPGGQRTFALNVLHFTSCDVYIWLESRAEIINVSYRMDSAIAPDRDSASVTAFRVGQASRPGKKKNYYNGGYARDCYLDQA